jgi:hypothetical protein
MQLFQQMQGEGMSPNNSLLFRWFKASAGLGALGSAVYSNNFLKPKENLLICRCLASNPK